MGFWDFLRRGETVPVAMLSPTVTYIGGTGAESLGPLVSGLDPAQMTVAQLWSTQPHLRTVVTFRARNVAHLGLHVFERVSDTDRRRDHESPLARALRRPDVSSTVYDLIFALVGDLDLYDRAYWIIGTGEDGSPLLRRLPPSWVTPIFKDPFTVKEYRVHRGADFVTVPADQILSFTGYSPSSPIGASPTIESLKETLREQIEAAAYRAQTWKRGGRVSAVLERPKDAPGWSDGAREAFRADWYAKYTGRGPQAGGTPILEDGMTLKRIDFNAQEQQFVEAAKLALSTVAAAYHVNPTMIGLLDNANYSNVREFRRMLYGDTLGPLLAQIEARLNAFLLPMLGMDSAKFYAEFNLAEKLQGSFEEQATVMSTLVGRPVMTADEGRARFNLPALGGDATELVTPLNVLIGGQTSPRDGVTAGGGGGLALTTDDIKQRVEAAAALIRSGFDPAGALAAVGLDPITHLGLLPVTVQRPQEPENVDQEAVDALKAAQLRVKARAPQTYEAKTAEVLTKFFRRQRAVVLTALGAKADGEWWDAERWDAELSNDLYALALSTAKQVSSEVLAGIGFEPDAYDEDRTLAFLRAVADSRATLINQATRDQIDAALTADEPAAAVFDTAESQRVSAASAALVTTFSAFATTEAAKQVAGDRAVKTWVVGSTNPRASHAAMNGETVGIEEAFSNGMNWPGDPSGGADEVAGCLCGVEVSIP